MFKSLLTLIFLLTLGHTLAQAADSSAAPSANAQPAQIYLLGEIHDNPESHASRLTFIKQLLRKDQRPIIAMEQFDREKQAALDQALTTCADTDCVIRAAGGAGWEWDFYKPFIQLALEKKVTLVAANLSNNDLRKIAREGFAAVYDPAFITQFKLDQLPPSLLATQYIAIEEGHCGMLPAQAIGPMARGQIARDVWMAHVIRQATSELIILIAGNGHVRKDAGVYQWLTAQQQATTQIFGFVESLENSDLAWYDTIHVIHPFLREDPCLVFKKS